VATRRRRARLRRVLHESQWWVIIAAAAASAVVLGVTGFRAWAEVSGGPTPTFWDLAYRTAQLFTLESGSIAGGENVPTSLQVARFLAPAVTAGAVVRAVVALFEEQAQMLRLRTMRRHVVVCGLGRKGAALSRSLREHGHRVVVVEQDAENDRVLTARWSGVPVLIGDSTDPRILRRAGVTRAAFLVALCGSSSVNAQVVTVAHGINRGRKIGLMCMAHVVEPELARLLQTRFPAARGPQVRLEFFDLYERAARVLLQRHLPFGGDGSTPHLLVVGLGRLGSRLVVEAARSWRLAGHAGRLRVDVLDPAAERQIAAMLAAHPEVADACDLQVTRLPADPGASIVYVCVGNEAQALQTALEVNQSLTDPATRVVVRAETHEGIPMLLSTAGSQFSGLRGFAMLDETCDADLLFGGFTETLAQMLHTHYLATREAQGWTHGPLDQAHRTHPAMEPWTELPARFKDSSRDQASHLWAKLARVGCELVELADWDAAMFEFTDGEVEDLARMEHERWCEHQRRTAPRRVWRAEHPNLVGWEELSAPEKDVDRAFIRSLPPVLAQLGYQIVRPGRNAPTSVE
jgi:hypothetical protein